jgi:hypothetical protein
MIPANDVTFLIKPQQHWESSVPNCGSSSIGGWSGTLVCKKGVFKKLYLPKDT